VTQSKSGMSEPPLEEILQPRTACLIVHDMQNDFIHEKGKYGKTGQAVDVSNAIDNIVGLLEVARTAGITLLYTVFTAAPEWKTFSAPMLQGVVKGDSAEAPPTLDGTWGWKVIDRLTPKPEDFLMRKYRVDAFEGTPLDLFLSCNRIKTIVHTGIAIERGIAPTAQRAFNLGYFPVVPVDCVSPRKKEYRESGLKYLEQWARMTTSSEIRDVWLK